MSLLFAPSSGKENRERLKSETEHLTKKVKDEVLRISGKFRVERIMMSSLPVEAKKPGKRP